MLEKPCWWEVRRDGAVCRLGLVSSIEGQRLPASAARTRSNPGILVGESPGLDRGAARTVQACAHDAAIDIGLARQVVSPRQAAGFYWQGNVKLRNVNLHAE